jgi:signal transduction histidine kinase
VITRLSAFIDDFIFPNIPFFTTAILCFLLIYNYTKDRDSRKLIFAVGLCFASVSYLMIFNDALLNQSYALSGKWLLIPMPFAVFIAVFAGMSKKMQVKEIRYLFYIYCLLSLLLFFTSIQLETLRITLMVVFMALSISGIIYLTIKTRDVSNIHFLLASLCFTVQGIVLDIGRSEEIPVILNVFGNTFAGLMFFVPAKDPRSLAYVMTLEKQLTKVSEDLKAAESRLLKAERLAAIGELAGMIGHDLRNPLQGISNAVFSLKKRQVSRLDQRGQQSIEVIEKCVERSNKIVNDLLDYAREIHLDITVITPRKLVESVISQVKIPENISIINLAKNTPEFNVDSAKIQRVFLNLVVNAFDAMPKGGSFTITSKVIENKVVFSFADIGEGMPSEVLSKIWTPLFTTKAKGMGFGLPICKRYVEAHGGQIDVTSQVGKGSVFNVALPLKHEFLNVDSSGQKSYASANEIARIWKNA